MLSVSKKVLVGRGVAMKGEIFFRRTDGTEIPVKEVRGLEGNGVLIIIMAQIIRKEDMQKNGTKYRNTPWKRNARDRA